MNYEMFTELFTWVHAQALGCWSEGEGKEESQGSKIKKQRVPFLVANHSWPDDEEDLETWPETQERRCQGGVRLQVA